MSSTVFILGGFGYIGFNLAKILSNNNYNIVIIDTIGSIVPIDFECSYYCCDIRNIAYMITLINKHKPECFIWSVDLMPCNNLYYDVFSIQYRLLYKNKPFLNELIKINKQIYKYFLVKPTIINDIYDLYVLNDKIYEKFSLAFIPDYRCSVMMNSLFRNIKENSNLDALEESDDEEEFENVSLDKFVDLDKKYVMKCLYLPKYKLWQPIETVNQNVSQKREILFWKFKNHTIFKR